MPNCTVSYVAFDALEHLATSTSTRPAAVAALLLADRARRGDRTLPARTPGSLLVQVNTAAATPAIRALGRWGEGLSRQLDAALVHPEAANRLTAALLLPATGRLAVA